MVVSRLGAERTESEEHGESPFSTEAIFDTLSNRRRRYVLQYLKRVDGPVAVRDLSEQLAAWENDIERSLVRPKERKRLYTALHQTHLPKMAELGVVEYDRNRGTVTLARSIRQFDIYFDLFGKRTVPWSQFYLALGGVLTTLVTVAALDVRPFSAVDGFAYAAAISVTFTVLAAYHTFHARSRAIGSVDIAPEAAPSPVATSEEGLQRDR